MQIPEASVKSPGGKPERIASIEFIRAVCALGIIAFHVSCYTAPEAAKLLHTHSNGDFGGIFVGIFFLISGGMLYRNNRDIPWLKHFYFKRWKSIFPMFYITWLYYYLDNVIRTGTPFYGGKPWTLVLTLLGLDGYLAYRIDGYYIVGEWFLGAIVLLYALYPVFLKLVDKLGWKILIPLVPLVVWVKETDFFTIHHSCNLIYCAALFIGGMLIFRYCLHRRRWLRLLSVPVFFLLLLVELPGPHYPAMILLVFSGFFTLLEAGEWVMGLRIPGSIFTFLGGLSFPIFLVQNKVGTRIVGSFRPMETDGVLKAVLLTAALCILYGWCIRAIAQAIMNTKWFSSLEGRILNKHKGA